MYADKKRLPMKTMQKLKKKYQIPNKNERINQYVTPDFTTHMDQEREAKSLSLL